MASYITSKATIVFVEVSEFTADEDARKLQAALEGEGADDHTIINILGNWSNEQRQMICLIYYKHCERSLHEDVKKKLSGEFQTLVLTLLTSFDNQDAELVHKATKGLGTDEDLLLEILCTRTHSQMRRAQESFKRKYGEEMSKAIKGDTSGDFKKFCIKLLERGGSHEAGGSVDLDAAKRDAQALYKAGEGKLGTDEATFINMLTDNSYAHLRAVFAAYLNERKHGIDVAIKKEFSLDIQKGLLTLVSVIKNTPGYFAEKLHKAITKRNDNAIIRILVSRSEIDLEDIKDEYQRMYEKPLSEAVEEKITGPYRVLLKAIIR